MTQMSIDILYAAITQRKVEDRTVNLAVNTLTDRIAYFGLVMYAPRPRNAFHVKSLNPLPLKLVSYFPVECLPAEMTRDNCGEYKFNEGNIERISQ
jgi:hypothetical protein